ncbi:MAG: creatininase family protein [Myxococcales bacterium]|nr:creatininase family protein [Myxococcales bacterium]
MANEDRQPPKFIQFERARPHEVRAMIDRTPIAYVPFGALEWHGEHAALGLDGIKAEAICRAAAKISGGVLFPPVYWGAFHTLSFPFTFCYSKRAMKKLVRRTLNSLADWGFRSIILLTGHYPAAQITLLRAECRRLSRARGIGALGIPEQALALDLGYLGDHAAKWETSLLMAIDPTLVDLSRLPDDTGSLRQRGIEQGIMGICPKNTATADLGRQVLDTVASRLAATGTRMLTEGERPAEEIYRAHLAAFRRPLAAARRAFGVESSWEAVRFVLGSIWRQKHL